MKWLKELAKGFINLAMAGAAISLFGFVTYTGWRWHILPIGLAIVTLLLGISRWLWRKGGGDD